MLSDQNLKQCAFVLEAVMSLRTDQFDEHTSNTPLVVTVNCARLIT